MSRPKRSEETTRRLRAELLEHARTIVRRDGAAALTMRALAAEAGVSVGLPYKVFADRREIVTEIVRGEITTLQAATEELVATAGRGTVGEVSMPARRRMDRAGSANRGQAGRVSTRAGCAASHASIAPALSRR